MSTGSSGDWGTYASERPRSRRVMATVGLPPMRTSPSWSTRPATARRRVVFPAPFAPMRPTHSPRPTDAVTASTAGRAPKRTDTASQLDHGAALGRADAAAATTFGQTDDPGHQVSPAPMPRPARRETRTTRKKGAPIQAVTTPIGTSAGAWTVRAMRSVPIRKAAPPTMATGRMMR